MAKNKSESHGSRVSSASANWEFYCWFLLPWIKLAIEIDWNSHDEKQDYDQNRQIILENLGVRFIRFKDIDVKQKMAWVLEELVICIEESKDYFNS